MIFHSKPSICITLQSWKHIGILLFALQDPPGNCRGFRHLKSSIYGNTQISTSVHPGARPPFSPRQLAPAIGLVAAGGAAGFGLGKAGMWENDGKHTGKWWGTNIDR